MKKMLAIAVAAAFAAPAISLADTTLYGILKTELVTTKSETAGAASSTETDMRDNGSRIGVKGSTPLNNGLAATYVVEYGTDITDNDTAGALGHRQTYVGIKGGFGEVRMGKQWGPTKLSSGKVEMFGDQVGDYNNILNGNGTVEPSQRDAIAYVNKFGNVGVAVLASEDFGGTTNSTTADVSVVDGMVNYSNNGVYLALGHQNLAGAPDTTRVTAAYKWPAGHQVGIVHEMIDTNTANGDRDNTLVSGKYKMGNVALKGQYGVSDIGGTNNNQTMLALGVDYSLGKKTKLIGEIVDMNDIGGTAGTDRTSYGAGIVHSF